MIEKVSPFAGMDNVESTDDGRFVVGQGGVTQIQTPSDRKVEFVHFDTHSLAYVKSSLGYPAYYPLDPVSEEGPVKAVLMDLDGTTIRSEEFWMWIIEKTTASVLGDDSFRLAHEDEPYVAGHSTSEHLQHCIDKYIPGKTVEEARELYFQHARHEMQEILEGRGKEGAFVPSPGIKEFLTGLKEMGIKLGLVTSGLYEKAWPEIIDGFRTLGMGEPNDFYDASITAGVMAGEGGPGNISELAIKPHPWLYSEVCRVGLGIPPEENGSVIGIEDSGAGVCSVRIAGFTTIGIGGGNIEKSGTAGLCSLMAEDFTEIMAYIKNRNK